MGCNTYKRIIETRLQTQQSAPLDKTTQSLKGFQIGSPPKRGATAKPSPSRTSNIRPQFTAAKYSYAQAAKQQFSQSCTEDNGVGVIDYQCSTILILWQKMVDEYPRKTDCAQILVCTFAVGGIGLNLQHMYWRINIFESTANLGVIYQAIGRIRRTRIHRSIMGFTHCWGARMARL